MPTTTGSTRAPRLSTFETTTDSTPRRSSSASVPEARMHAEQVAVPGPVERGACPSAPTKRLPSGPQPRRRRLREEAAAARGRARRRARARRRRSRSSSSGRRGSRRRARVARRSVSRSFTSRKLRPSSASATALTPPPKRVAMPPASTTSAISARLGAPRPRPRPPRRSRARPGPAGASGRNGSGGSTTPGDDVAAATQRAVGELAPQPLEHLGIEPVALEDRAGGGIDLVEDHRERTGAGSDVGVRSAMHALLGHDRRDQRRPG